MARVVQCPTEFAEASLNVKYTEHAATVDVTQHEKSLFVAGGISGCEQWQKQFISFLKPVSNLVLLNPRRETYDLKNLEMSHEQIEWEHRHLEAADGISFWFPYETLCPITLYELGYWMNSNKQIFIGTHPLYARRFDVVKQTSLSRPNIVVVHSLKELVLQVAAWVNGVDL